MFLSLLVQVCTVVYENEQFLIIFCIL